MSMFDANSLTRVPRSQTLSLRLSMVCACGDIEGMGAGPDCALFVSRGSLTKKGRHMLMASWIDSDNRTRFLSRASTFLLTLWYLSSKSVSGGSVLAAIMAFSLVILGRCLEVSARRYSDGAEAVRLGV